MEPEGRPAKRSKRPRKRRSGSDELDVERAEMAAWDIAVNDVVASVLAEDVRRHGEYQRNPELYLHAMRRYVAEARRELGEHPASTDCTCRQDAIITADACYRARQTGSHPGVLVDGAKAILRAYLERRS